MLSPMIEEISHYVNIDKDALMIKGIQSVLTDKKRDILLERLNILSKYDAASKEELEDRIEQGSVSEHPAWEDLILLENLEAEFEKINGYLRNL